MVTLNVMEIKKVIEDLASDLLAHLSFEGGVKVGQEKNLFRVELEPSREEAGMVIGSRGEGLDAFQKILSLAVFQTLGEWVYLLVDCRGYRAEERERLRGLAEKAAERARLLSTSVPLPPMNPYRRRLIHLAVSEMEDMESESQGGGRDRRVVLKPKP